jgi:isopenicillin N synthase-like dioxygenase
VVVRDDGKDDRRMSIAFFVNMNGDAHVEPIDSCGQPKYNPITAGAHLMAKHFASMGIAGDEL